MQLCGLHRWRQGRRLPHQAAPTGAHCPLVGTSGTVPGSSNEPGTASPGTVSGGFLLACMAGALPPITNTEHVARMGGAGEPHALASQPVAWPPPLAVPSCADAAEGIAAAPSELCCPITHAVFREPAVTPQGVTYERTALVQWLQAAGTDPSSGRPCALAELAPNRALRAAIERWLASRTSCGRCAACCSAQQEAPPRPSRPAANRTDGPGGRGAGGRSAVAASSAGTTLNPAQQQRQQQQQVAREETGRAAISGDGEEGLWHAVRSRRKKVERGNAAAAQQGSG